MTLHRSTGMLNKLAGLRTNLLTSDNFATTTGWSGDMATLSVATNVLTVTSTSTTLPAMAYQNVATVPGRTYKITVDFKVGTAVSGFVYAGATGGGTDSGRDLTSIALTQATKTTLSFAFVAVDAITRISLGALQGGVVGKTAEFSNVKLEEILDGFQEIFRNCNIAVYTGTQPASADDAKNGTLLYTISKDGAGLVGLTWDDASNGTISKSATEVWRGTAVAAGNAGWFRCYEAGSDPAVSSVTAARFDGSISTTAGEIIMANINVELNAVQSITVFTYSQPKG